MKRQSTATASVAIQTEGPAIPPRAAGRRKLAIAAVAAGLLVSGVLLGATDPPRGADDPPAGPRAVGRSAFVAEIRRTLKADDFRLIALANQVLDDPTAPGGLDDQIDRARIEATKAEGEYQYATLKREIGELVLKEYVEAVVPQEIVAKDADLSVAHASLVRAHELAKQAKDEVAKVTSQLEEQKAALSIEMAESKRRVLAKFERSRRTKELEAQLAKARSEELSRKAECEVHKRRLEKLQKTASVGPTRTEVERRILALLGRAVPIEEQIQAKLQRLANEPLPGEAAEREIRDQVDDLGVLIDEAEAIKAADDLSRLKARLPKAARP
jgi:hypothetical protein